MIESLLSLVLVRCGMVVQRMVSHACDPRSFVGDDDSNFLVAGSLSKTFYITCIVGKECAFVGLYCSPTVELHHTFNKH